MYDGVNLVCMYLILKFSRTFYWIVENSHRNYHFAHTCNRTNYTHSMICPKIIMKRFLYFASSCFSWVFACASHSFGFSHLKQNSNCRGQDDQYAEQ